MTIFEAKRRATVHDVARTAGVSLATVDRVLNGRPGVRAKTADKVAAAIETLGFRRDLSASLLARARAFQLVFLIPDGDNAFMEELAVAVARQATVSHMDRVHLTTQRFHALDAKALADALDRLRPDTCDVAVIVASEEPPVLEAVASASRRGIAVITLVSDLPGSARRRFVGIDNLAAGRTAAALMGRFCPEGGRIGLIVGSLTLRDHRERLEGFRQVAETEFRHLSVLEPREAHDDSAETERVATALLAEHRDLKGLYNLGAGNAGLVCALEATPLPHPRSIVHEISAHTREALASGLIDVVIDQNPDAEIRAAIAAARALLLGAAAPELIEPIEIGLFLRDNLR